MLNDVIIDYDKVNRGIWRELGLSSFLVAHTCNERFKSDLVISLNGSTSIEKTAFCKILADCILLDWRGVKQPDGQDLKYTKSLATYALLTNQELFDFVESVSNDLSLYQ